MDEKLIYKVHWGKGTLLRLKNAHQHKNQNARVSTRTFQCKRRSILLF